MAGLCAPWTTVEQALEVRPTVAARIDPDIIARTVQSASEILNRLTGRQFSGLCTKTVRPVSRPSTVLMQRWITLVANYGGYWAPAIGTWDYDVWAGDAPASIPLGVYPVVSIVQVTIDGLVVDPSIYRVDNSRLLVRQDGGVWPTWQTIQAPLGDPGTFGVTVEYGEAPPQDGIDAAGSFAVELALAGSDEGRLPNGVVSLSRQGVTETMVDPTTFYKLGLTGLPEVDSFIASVNPSGRRHRPRVVSPDVIRTRS